MEAIGIIIQAPYVTVPYKCRFVRGETMDECIGHIPP